MFSPDQQILLEKCSEGFPGGSVVKNPPANAGDTGLILGLGRFHMIQNNSACVPQLLSFCSRAQDLQLLKLLSPRARLRNLRSHCNEKPSHCHEEQPLLTTAREKPMEQQDPAQPTINKCIKWNHKKRKMLRILFWRKRISNTRIYFTRCCSDCSITVWYLCNHKSLTSYWGFLCLEPTNWQRIG